MILAVVIVLWLYFGQLVFRRLLVSIRRDFPSQQLGWADVGICALEASVPPAGLLVCLIAGAFNWQQRSKGDGFQRLTAWADRKIGGES